MIGLCKRISGPSNSFCFLNIAFLVGGAKYYRKFFKNKIYLPGIGSRIILVTSSSCLFITLIIIYLCSFYKNIL